MPTYTDVQNLNSILDRGNFSEFKLLTTPRIEADPAQKERACNLIADHLDFFQAEKRTVPVTAVGFCGNGRYLFAFQPNLPYDGKVIVVDLWEPSKRWFIEHHARSVVHGLGDRLLVTNRTNVLRSYETPFTEVEDKRTLPFQSAVAATEDTITLTEHRGTAWFPEWCGRSNIHAYQMSENCLSKEYDLSGLPTDTLRVLFAANKQFAIQVSRIEVRWLKWQNDNFTDSTSMIDAKMVGTEGWRPVFFEVAISPDDREIVLVVESRIFRWKVQESTNASGHVALGEREEIKVFDKEKPKVLAYSPCGRYLAFVSWTGVIAVIKTGEPVQDSVACYEKLSRRLEPENRLATYSQIGCVAWSPVDDLIAVGTQHGVKVESIGAFLREQKFNGSQREEQELNDGQRGAKSRRWLW